MSEQLNTTDESVTSSLADASETTENSVAETSTSGTSASKDSIAETSAPETAETSKSEVTFHDLPLAPPILKALDRAKFTVPTPIQAQAIPVVTAGNDLIGIAQTGTGKTLAFGLPILQNFIENRNAGRALILLPTRELALQVEEALQGMARQFKLRSAVLIGGAPIRQQWAQLRANPDLIVATPGRLIDHLKNGAVDLRSVDTLVLDEADRMLDMGFAPQIDQIVSAIPRERQTLLFSATMPAAIEKMAQDYMRDPQRIEIEKAGTSAENITQELFVVPQDSKNDLLAQVLYETTGPVLVFTRTRSRARRVSKEVNGWDIRAAEIHADRTLAQRRAALDGFKAGKYRVLVATDIAARGIDVKNIEVVVNYDLPDSPDDYIHRIGRTARAGASGKAISFAAPDQGRDVRDIERLMRMTLPLAEGNKYELEVPKNSSGGGRKRGPSRGGGNRSFGGGGGNRGGSGGGNRDRRPARAR